MLDTYFDKNVVILKNKCKPIIWIHRMFKQVTAFKTTLISIKSIGCLFHISKYQTWKSDSTFKVRYLTLYILVPTVCFDRVDVSLNANNPYLVSPSRLSLWSHRRTLWRLRWLCCPRRWVGRCSHTPCWHLHPLVVGNWLTDAAPEAGKTDRYNTRHFPNTLIIQTLSSVPLFENYKLITSDFCPKRCVSLVGWNFDLSIQKSIAYMFFAGRILLIMVQNDSSSFPIVQLDVHQFLTSARTANDSVTLIMM